MRSHTPICSSLSETHKFRIFRLLRHIPAVPKGIQSPGNEAVFPHPVIEAELSVHNGILQPASL